MEGMYIIFKLFVYGSFVLNFFCFFVIGCEIVMTIVILSGRVILIVIYYLFLCFFMREK